MMGAPNRIEVLHGVNLNLLGARDPLHYGTLTLADLEAQIGAWAAELDLSASFFQTNAESEYVERLHALRGPPTQVAGVILNPGSWTHYAYALHDALELTGLPAVEVHLSDVQSREPWRRQSVIGDLCLATYSGKGPEGYRLALGRLREELQAGRS
jgi:3-dehydroquinate dehydratase-2